MLIPQKSVLFVHVPKAAGQSMENALLSSLGQSREEHGPEYLLCKNNDPNLGPPRLAHLTANQYTALGYMQSEDFDSYFKFGFVRNPWSRVVSFYRYSGLAPLIEFECFVLVYLERLLRDRYWFYRPQTDFLFSEDNKALVDFIGRFETLDTDWASCASKIEGVPKTLPKDNYTEEPRLLSRKTLAWIKIYPDLLYRFSLTNKPHLKYQDYYTEATRDKVALFYERDIDLLGYEFQGL